MKKKKNKKDIASKNIYIGCVGILFMDYKKRDLDLGHNTWFILYVKHLVYIFKIQ